MLSRHKNVYTLPVSFTGSTSCTEDEPNFPRQNNLVLRKRVSGVDKVVNFKDFSRPHKEINYFFRTLTEFKDFSRRLGKIQDLFKIVRTMQLSPSISSLPVACFRLSKVVEANSTDRKRCVNCRLKAGEGSPPIFPLFSLTRFFLSFSLTESLAWVTLPVRLRRSACGTSLRRVAMTDG